MMVFIMKKQIIFLTCMAFLGIGISFFYFYSTVPNASEIPPIPFYFIRHGQTDNNVKNIVAGSLDTPLNATGITQAHNAAQLLEKSDVQIIISSPLKRTYQTAEIIAQKLHKPIIIMNEFKERSAGSFEGEPEGPWLIKWIYGKCRIPGAENYTAFSQRIIDGLKKALQLKGPVLIVSHGGVFDRLKELLKLDHNGLIKNATPVFITPPRNENANWKSINFATT